MVFRLDDPDRNEFRAAADRMDAEAAARLVGNLDFVFLPLRTNQTVHIQIIEALDDHRLMQLYAVLSLFADTGGGTDGALLRVAVEGEMIERGLL